MAVKNDYFDPKTCKYPYPEKTDRHYLVVKKDNGTVYDEHYPYIDKSPWFRFRQFLVRLVCHILVFPLARIRLGLRVEGKANLKKHRDLFRSGLFTTSNHVHMWDYLGILSVLGPKNQFVLSWAPDISGENGTLIRMVGGIPIPEHSFRGTHAYLAAVKEAVGSGKRVQIYAEGSMWEYYRPIRPFKRGVAYLAIQCGKPVLPMAYTYREPGWIRKHVFHQTALFTLHIGEPIFADGTLEGKEEEREFTIRLHDEVCRLAGIDPAENVYPPVFDDSDRIDYYTTEYGIGYKGSW